MLNTARELVERIADALGGEIAGRSAPLGRPLVRPRRSSCPRAGRRGPGRRSSELPQIVTVDRARRARRARRDRRRACPSRCRRAGARRFGTELVRATGTRTYVEAWAPLPDAADEAAVYAALGIPWCPPELREAPFPASRRTLVELGDVRGDLHCHTTWSDGKASVLEMATAARELGYEYLAICDHTPNVRVVPGSTPTRCDVRREEIPAANEQLAPFRVLRGVEVDILRDGGLDLPDDVLAELDWVQLSLHAGQREPRRDAHGEGHGGDAPPGRQVPHPPEGANPQPPAAERTRPRGRVRGGPRDTAWRSRSNGLPDRLDLAGPDVRLAIEAGVADRRLDGRALRPRAREHAPGGRHRPARLGDGRRRAQHASPRQRARAPRTPIASARGRPRRAVRAQPRLGGGDGRDGPRILRRARRAPVSRVPVDRLLRQPGAGEPDRRPRAGRRVRPPQRRERRRAHRPQLPLGAAVRGRRPAVSST